VDLEFLSFLLFLGITIVSKRPPPIVIIERGQYSYILVYGTVLADYEYSTQRPGNGKQIMLKPNTEQSVAP
jgi:hypothetical protein